MPVTRTAATCAGLWRSWGRKPSRTWTGLKFADGFERQFITQGDEDRPIEKTLAIAWDLFATLPVDELKRIKREHIKKYHPAAQEAGAPAAEKTDGS